MSLAKLDSLVVATIPDAMRLVVVRNCVVALVHCWNNFDALVAYHCRQKLKFETPMAFVNYVCIMQHKKAATAGQPKPIG
jgi:hypothetical protein